MLRLNRFAALCLLACAASAQAETIRPGLWEFTHQMHMDGQKMPGMEEMLQQLANMPPAQRQMMEQMMARQGVQIGNKGVRTCMTAEKIQAAEMPVQGREDCTQEIVERTDKHWKFRFSCPDSQGEGETEFLNDKEFTTHVTGTYQREAGSKSMEMNSHATWVGEDCGNLKPVK